MTHQEYFQKGEITNAIIELSNIVIIGEGELEYHSIKTIESFIDRTKKFNKTYERTVELINSLNFYELDNQVKIFNKIQQLNTIFKGIVIDLFSMFKPLGKNSDSLNVPLKIHLDDLGITDTFYFPGDALKSCITYISYIQLQDERTRLPKNKLYKFDVGDEPYGFTRLSEEVMVINNALFLEIIHALYELGQNEDEAIYKEELTGKYLFRISEFLAYNDFDNLKLYNLLTK